MADIEKVIKALTLEAEHANDWQCRFECPYYGKTECDCYEQVARDAVALLKEQEETIAAYAELLIKHGYEFKEE